MNIFRENGTPLNICITPICRSSIFLGYPFHCSSIHTLFEHIPSSILHRIAPCPFEKKDEDLVFFLLFNTVVAFITLLLVTLAFATS